MTMPDVTDSADATPANGVASAASEFVITDAPLPDHTASADGDDILSTRSPDRTEALKNIGKRGPGRPRKTDEEKAADKAAKPVPPMPRGGFTKELEELYGTIALMMLPFDAECAMALMEAAPKCAESLDALAKKNPAVRRVLVTLTQTSAWGAVLAAHAPIIIAITVHHVPAVRNSPMGVLLSGKGNAPEANIA